MIKIAIVEDDKRAAALLNDYISMYQQQSGLGFSVEYFTDGIHFISDYTATFDIIFMDIEMPGMDGLTTAKKLREIDAKVCLIFVTNMAQYAISGYEVQALDFLIKPIGYEFFVMKMEKALRYCEKHEDVWVILPDEMGKAKVKLSDICYVESSKHYLLYHTKQKVYKVRESLRNIEGQYMKNNFVLASNTCLVNLAYVTKYTENSVMIGDECIPISRSRRKEFANLLTTSLGGGVL